MTRHQRRAAQAQGRYLAGDDNLIIAHDRATLVRKVAAMVESDETVSGATLITADGKVSYIDAETLRQGGRA